MSSKRIVRDINLIQDKSIYNLKQVSPYKIICQIKGPKDTYYEEGEWRISILFSDRYPFKSPSVGFLDKIYHPNIDFDSGTICLNVLNLSWSPIYTALHIVETFLPQLLTYPNPDDPLNQEASILYNENRTLFTKKVNKYLSIS